LRPPKKPSKAELIAAQRKADAEARLKRDMDALRMWQESVRAQKTPSSTEPKRSPLQTVSTNVNSAANGPAKQQQQQASLHAFFQRQEREGFTRPSN